MRNYKIGERSNVIPAHVEAVLEFKVLPYGSQEEIETFVRKQIAGLPLEMEVLGYEAGFESNFENSHLKQLVNDLEEACRRFGFDRCLRSDERTEDFSGVQAAWFTAALRF